MKFNLVPCLEFSAEIGLDGNGTVYASGNVRTFFIGLAQRLLDGSRLCVNVGHRLRAPRLSCPFFITPLQCSNDCPKNALYIEFIPYSQIVCETLILGACVHEVR